MSPPKPTKADLLAANDRTIPDLIGPNLSVLFCGINPGLYSGATGHHFARPGNRFWPALFAGGFTPEKIDPWDEQRLLPLGLGITNLVARTTATAAELSADELIVGAKSLAKKLKKFNPRFIAFLGVGAYGSAFSLTSVKLGLQPKKLADTAVWVLPNPSGLNAHYQPAKLAELFAELRQAAMELTEPSRLRREQSSCPQPDGTVRRSE